MPEHHYYGPRSVWTFSSANPLHVKIKRHGKNVEESIIFDSWEDLERRAIEEGIMVPSGPKGTFVNREILNYLQKSLKAAGRYPRTMEIPAATPPR
jgi:hypothetical protein